MRLSSKIEIPGWVWFLLTMFLCWEIRHTLLLIYVSIVFAVVFTPAVRWIQQRQIRSWHPSTGTAVLILIAAAVAVLLLFGAFVVPSVSGDVQKLAQDLPARINKVKGELATLPFGERLLSSKTGSGIGSAISTSIEGLISSIGSVVKVVTDLLLVALLAAYLIVDRRRTFKWTMSLLSARTRSRLQPALEKGSSRMQKWLHGQALLMLILGSSSFVVFWAIGVPYFYALAAFAALANFVPVLGPIATVVVAGVLAATDSWSKLLGVIVFYLVYQQIENSFLTPRIMKKTVELSPVAVIVALAIGSALAGIAGALVAVPTAALIATLLDSFVIRDSSDESGYAGDKAA